jgi:hypothetical protein
MLFYVLWYKNRHQQHRTSGPILRSILMELSAKKWVKGDNYRKRFLAKICRAVTSLPGTKVAGKMFPHPFHGDISKVFFAINVMLYIKEIQ